MKKCLFGLSLALATLACLPIKAAESSYNYIIFFGDSLSDNGNLYNRLFGLVPDSPPYFKGRFTNGQTWAERVADHFKQENQISSENYAVAGTTAVYHNPFENYLPYTLTDEIDNYLLRWLFSDKNKSLYIFWIGGNDYIAGPADIDARTTTVINSIRNNIETLISHGGKQFLLMNLPDLSKSPEGQQSSVRENIRALSLTHNQKLANLATELQNKYPQIKVRLFDVYTPFNELIENPEKFNLQYQTQISNSMDACWHGGYRVRSLSDQQQTNLSSRIEAKLKQNQHSLRFSTISTENLHARAEQLAEQVMNTPDVSVAYDVSTSASLGERPCLHPENYVFWDKMHPSAAVHSIFSAKMIEYIQQNYP